MNRLKWKARMLWYRIAGIWDPSVKPVRGRYAETVFAKGTIECVTGCSGGTYILKAPVNVEPICKLKERDMPMGEPKEQDTGKPFPLCKPVVDEFESYVEACESEDAHDCFYDLAAWTATHGRQALAVLREHLAQSKSNKERDGRA